MKRSSTNMAVLAFVLLSTQALADTGGGQAGADKAHAEMMAKINRDIADGAARNEARCTELATNQTASFQKRLQAMAPSQSPTTYVDNNTGVRDLLSRISGGGLFSGFNIASYVTGLAGQQLQRDNSMAASSFLGGVNNVLSRFNTPGFNLSSLSAGSVATPPFQPVQVPTTSATPSAASSLKAGISSFFSPYTR